MPQPCVAERDCASRSTTRTRRSVAGDAVNLAHKPSSRPLEAMTAGATQALAGMTGQYACSLALSDGYASITQGRCGGRVPPEVFKSPRVIHARRLGDTPIYFAASVLDSPRGATVEGRDLPRKHSFLICFDTKV
jgi:hypothetical protein